MRERRFSGLSRSGFHRITYWDWGDPANDRVVVCVHGLTRTGRDFDHLAEALAGTFRVVCPDLPGRGRSEWLTVAEEYGLPTYLADMAALVARLGVEQVDWVGTSLGGILGMILAAQRNSVIRRLVVNDVGAFVPKASLERIADYVGLDPLFADVPAAEAYLRQVHAPFGPLSDEHWRHLTLHSIRPDGETGGVRLHYDPALAVPFRTESHADIDLWPVWDRVACPVLIVRGVQSDLFPREVADEMLKRGPSSRLVEIDDTGHAPMLMDRNQVATVQDWLGS
jgi:pimeloyl-ACP methyl ester carboxylesterase